MFLGKIVSRLVVGLSFVALAACGGGGGGGGGGGTPLLDLSRAIVDFERAAGSLSESQTVRVTTPPGTQALVLGYPSGGVRPSWVNYFIEGTSFTSRFDLVIRISLGSLTAGIYTDNVIVEARDGIGQVIARGNLRINVTITDALQVNRNRLDFYTAGATSNLSETISLSRINNSGTWSAATNQAWLTLNSTSGSTPFDLVVEADPTGLPQGPNTATIEITDNLTNELTNIPVTLNIEQRRLEVDDNGIALTSLPSRGKLSQTINISENAGIVTSWSAVSDQTWLTLSSPTGTTDSPLTVTANSTGLSTNTIHYATVTISSSDPSVINTETVRVGFYVGSSNPPLTSIVSGFAQTDYPSGLVADPIRPYIYISHAASEIEVYNVYTRSIENTIRGGANDLYGEIEVSSDGTYLYFVNRNDSSINMFNLDTMSVESTWSGINFPVYTSTPSLSHMDLRFARLNGYPVLVTSGLQVIDAASGNIMANLDESDTFFRPPMIALSPDGETAFASLANYAYFDLYRYELGYSYSTNTVTAFRAQQRPRNTRENSPIDMAMNFDGTLLLALHTLNSNRYFMSYTNDANMTQSVVSSPSQVRVAVAVGPTGKVYVVDSTSGDDVIDIYDDSLRLISSASISAETVNRQLTTSADGMRLILRSRGTSTDELVFTTISP